MGSDGRRSMSRSKTFADSKTLEKTLDDRSKSPDWQPDDSSNHCLICRAEWTLARRRELDNQHHCRLCGQLVCGSCSSFVTANGKPNVRICSVCGNSLARGGASNARQSTATDRQIDFAIEQTMEASASDAESVESSTSVPWPATAQAPERPKHPNWVYMLAATAGQQFQIGQVSITVVEARELPAGDANGKSDPYTLVRLGNAEEKTNTIFKTVNPFWNKCFNFHVVNSQMVIEFFVYDFDRITTDDFLGSAKLPLSDLIDQNTRDIWIDLENASRNYAGSLRVIVQYVYSDEAEFWSHFCAKGPETKPVKPKLNVALALANYNRLMTHVWPLLDILWAILDLWCWTVPYKSAAWYLTCMFFALYPQYLPFAASMSLVFNSLRVYATREVEVVKKERPHVTKEENRSFSSAMTAGVMPKYYSDLLLWVQENLAWYCDLIEWIKGLFTWEHPPTTKALLFIVTVWGTSTLFISFRYSMALLVTYLFAMWSVPYAVFYQLFFTAMAAVSQNLLARKARFDARFKKTKEKLVRKKSVVIKPHAA